MPTNPPLTAAELDAIEARWAAEEAAVLRRDTASGTPKLADASRDVARMAAALREVWALVEALAETYSDGLDEYGFCDLCGRKLAGRNIQSHAPDCAWEAARAAKARWSGADKNKS